MTNLIKNKKLSEFNKNIHYIDLEKEIKALILKYKNINLNDKQLNKEIENNNSQAEKDFFKIILKKDIITLVTPIILMVIIFYYI